jgi:hypothetical protein
MKIVLRVLPEVLGSDYICPVCGEPWDRCGVLDGLNGRNGDMTREEAELFLNGWGCPACKSNIPHRLEAVDECFKLLEELENRIEMFELMSLYVDEYRNIVECIRKLGGELDKIWSKLKREERRIAGGDKDG